MGASLISRARALLFGAPALISALLWPQVWGWAAGEAIGAGVAVVNRLIAFSAMPWNHQLALVLIVISIGALFWPLIITRLRRKRPLPKNVNSALQALSDRIEKIGALGELNQRSTVALFHRAVIERSSDTMRNAERDVRNLPTMGEPQEAWNRWSVAHSEWQTALQHWIVYAQGYFGLNLSEKIHNAPDGWFDREWAFTDIQFPSDREKRTYQEWVAARDTWEKMHPRAMQLVSFVCAMGRMPEDTELPPV